MEFKLSHVKEIGAKAVTITFFQALSATLFVDVVLVATAFFTGMQTYEAIVLGAIATATAPAATLMVVRQYHAKGIVTDTLLPVVALDDAIGLVVFAVSNSIALSLASGSAVTFWNLAVVPVVEILMSLVVGALVGLLLAVVPRFFKSRDNRLIATVFAVFACLGLCTLFEYLEQNYNFPFTLSDLLVCMMAGAVFVNVRKEAAQMMENTDHWTPPILMLFFILSGAELNVATFFGNPKLLICILLYLVARCLGKYLGARLGATITKADPMVRKYLGITLFPQAGVAIGMATMCKQEFTKAELESVGSGIVTITMCAVMVYELLGPVLTKWALGRAHEIDPKLLSPRKFKAAKAYAEANGKTYQYYQPKNGDKATDADRIQAMNDAIKDGAKVIVTPGFLQEAAIRDVAGKNPEVKFIFIDGYPVTTEKGGKEVLKTLQVFPSKNRNPVSLQAMRQLKKASPSSAERSAAAEQTPLATDLPTATSSAQPKLLRK